jgi:hypothetical protein
MRSKSSEGKESMCMSIDFEWKMFYKFAQNTGFKFGQCEWSESSSYDGLLDDNTLVRKAIRRQPIASKQNISGERSSKVQTPRRQFRKVRC